MMIIFLYTLSRYLKIFVYTILDWPVVRFDMNDNIRERERERGRVGKCKFYQR